MRRGFKRLFEAPITIRDPEEPLGTHVFTVMDSPNEGAALRWTVVSIPEGSPRPPQGSTRRHKSPARQMMETTLTELLARQGQGGSRPHRHAAGCGRAHRRTADAGLFAHRVRLRSQQRDRIRHGFHCGNALRRDAWRGQSGRPLPRGNQSNQYCALLQTGCRVIWSM